MPGTVLKYINKFNTPATIFKYFAHFPDEETDPGVM